MDRRIDRCRFVALVIWLLPAHGRRFVATVAVAIAERVRTTIERDTLSADARQPGKHPAPQARLAAAAPGKDRRNAAADGTFYRGPESDHQSRATDHERARRRVGFKHGPSR
jgi:hypothetical protein